MTALRENPAQATAPDFTADAPRNIPPLSALPPLSARDFLHLNAIDAWASAAAGKRPSRIDPRFWYQQMHEAFETGDGTGNLLDQFHYHWEHIALRHGFTIRDERGGLLPGAHDAITGLITSAIWFGITTGHFTVTGGEYRIPRRLSRYLEADGLGLPRPDQVRAEAATGRHGCWLSRCLRGLLSPGPRKNGRRNGTARGAVTMRSATARKRRPAEPDKYPPGDGQ